MSSTITKFISLLSRVVIIGTKKRWFFSRAKEFSVKIYYTPFKKRILIIRTIGIELDDLPFTIGDDVSKAREWCTENKYKIESDLNRLTYD